MGLFTLSGVGCSRPRQEMLPDALALSGRLFLVFMLDLVSCLAKAIVPTALCMYPEYARYASFAVIHPTGETITTLPALGNA